ncbi:MAG: DUF98 domain-containing protein [Okeania sp. SIO3B3]|nr:DUF98 domain-containing protein [Okeania sp. SIO3B3]
MSMFQRMILITDGTLTEMLEVYLAEKIHLVKLSEQTFTLTETNAPLDLTAGTEVIERKILLQGKISRNNWIYAQSLLVPSRLDPHFRERLLQSREPMGRLWLEHKLETFKEIIDTAREPALDIATHFKIRPEDRLLSRTYRLFSNRQPIIMITEKFPESYFLNAF